MGKRSRIDGERAKAPRDRMSAAEIQAWTTFEQTVGSVAAAKRQQLDTGIVQRAQVLVNVLVNPGPVKEALGDDQRQAFKDTMKSTAEFIKQVADQGIALIVERSAIEDEPEEEDEDEESDDGG